MKSTKWEASKSMTQWPNQEHVYKYAYAYGYVYACACVYLRAKRKTVVVSNEEVSSNYGREVHSPVHNLTIDIIHLYLHVLNLQTKPKKKNLLNPMFLGY